VAAPLEAHGGGLLELVHHLLALRLRLLRA
jgi:hypothetical protein